MASSSSRSKTLRPLVGQVAPMRVSANRLGAIRAAALGGVLAVGGWILNPLEAAPNVRANGFANTTNGASNNETIVASTPSSIFDNYPSSASSPQSEMADAAKATIASTQDQQIVHVLNRLAFGPRPGDVEDVKRIGIAHWIDQQLTPSLIDDSAVDQKLGGFKTLNYSLSQLTLAYASDQILQRVKNEARKQREAELKGVAYTPPPNLMNARQQQLMDQAQQQGFSAGISMQIVGEMQSAKILRALESKRQLQEVLTDFWANHFNLDIRKQAVRTLRLADERDVIRPRVFGTFRDLLGASAHSPAMLIYLDNASSSVAVPINNPNKKRPAQTNNPNDDMARREAALQAQEAALQRQQQLLQQQEAQFQAQQRRAAARPARRSRVIMQGGQIYTLPNGGFAPGVTIRSYPEVAPLDASSSANTTATPLATPVATSIAAATPKMRGGVNENYAREIMELHTLGVGGGYTQKDVQEVARCFTGWSVDRDTGEFRFYPNRHDDGQKIVLGHVIPAGGGEQDGERVLDILAAHPSTAHFIATKMCERLVSDTPPPALINRIAQVYLRTSGDLKQVTRAIVTSPEFMAASDYRTKIKSPFEYAISAARALDATYVMPVEESSEDQMTMMANGVASVRPNLAPVVDSGKGRYGKYAGKTLTRQIDLMGEPLYSFQAPTGYSEYSQDWVSSGALIARLNFALDLTNGRIPDVQISRDKLFQGLAPNDKAAWLARLEKLTLQGDISTSTQRAVQAQLKPNTPFDAATIGALLLGSPEFQRR